MSVRGFIYKEVKRYFLTSFTLYLGALAKPPWMTMTGMAPWRTLTLALEARMGGLGQKRL